MSIPADKKRYLWYLHFLFFLLREKLLWFTLSGINLPAGTRQQRNTEVSRINSGTIPAGKQTHHRKSQRWVLQLPVMPTHCLCVVGLTCCQNCSKSEHLPLKRRQLRLLVEIHIQHIPNATLSRQLLNPWENTLLVETLATSSHHWVLLIWHTVCTLSETHWQGWDQRRKGPVFNKNTIRWSCVWLSG